MGIGMGNSLVGMLLYHTGNRLPSQTHHTYSGTFSMWSAVWAPKGVTTTVNMETCPSRTLLGGTDGPTDRPTDRPKACSLDGEPSILFLFSVGCVCELGFHGSELPFLFFHSSRSIGPCFSHHANFVTATAAMSSAGPVLGIIRASRPVLRNALDRAAFAVHATFLAAGYSLVATGNKANSSTAGREEETEIGIDGWDEMNGAYAFRYSGSGQPDLLPTVTVKCMVMGDSLMVDAVSSDSDTPVHTEIKASLYAADEDASLPYNQQYTNLEGLVNLVNSSILGKLSPKKEKTPAVASRTTSHEQTVEARRSSEMGSSLIDDRQRSGGPGFAYPQVPGYDGNDLYPAPGAGVFVPGGNPFGGPGMLVGPNDPRWGPVGVPRPGHLGIGGGVPGVLPGARFDPYGPPGVPGFEPNRFTRDPRRGPGGHPDLEHFSNDDL